MARILIVDDEVNMRWALEKALSKEGHRIVTATDGTAGLQVVLEDPPELVLCDLKMPGIDGIQLLSRLREIHPSLPVIMITGYGTVETAVQAMKLGAADFILKPFDLEAVRIAVSKALGMEKLKEEVRFWRQEARGAVPAGLIGRSLPMQELLQLVQLVAPTSATVLIVGESGTGKELVAQAIHQLSPRQDQPLIKVNCAALPENLLESEFFGHEKGAFTGAAARKLGRFERADQGTIFLDEIGEITPAMQVKLLRVIQEKEIERVGGTETHKIDVRIITATNRDLKAEVQAGRFREDLYYRLKVVPVEVPPLRKRSDDIPELATYFVQRFGNELGKGQIRISVETMELLQRYSWPGNVRELQNVIERAVILCTEPIIVPELLPLEVLSPGSEHEGEGNIEEDQSAITLPETGLDLEAVERSLIRQAIERAEGNQTQAARLLGISRYTLIYRMDKYGIGKS